VHGSRGEVLMQIVHQLKVVSAFELPKPVRILIYESEFLEGDIWLYV